MNVFDTTNCTLGEGPLWHPGRQSLFWFDILSKRVLMKEGNQLRDWQFETCVSAAGWVCADQILIASEIELFTLDITTGKTDTVVALEAEKPETRSNDGRADPFGGFWIGTMGKAAQTGAGAIYRYFKGELRKLISNITISNAICFSPNGDAAYFADTSQQIIHRWRLSGKDGWPIGDPEPFIDLRADNIHPDGAVVDQSGCLWNAQWGSGRVARYSPEGAYLDHIQCPASQSSCPAFGGETLTSLFVTSAAIGVNEPQAGQTFFVKDIGAKGQAEHQVLL